MLAQDDSGDPHYAIPPLDGVNWQPQEGAVTDGKMDWKQRKAQFMAGIDTRDAVETYIRALDAGISDTIAKLAASDSEFALWDTINRWGYTVQLTPAVLVVAHVADMPRKP